MASNETQPPDDFDDVGLSDNDDDDVPTSGNKRKNKETGDEGDRGGSSKKKKKTTSRSYVWDHFSRQKKMKTSAVVTTVGKSWLVLPSEAPLP